MILNDAYIKRLVEEGTLTISPYKPENVQPASVDITLADSFSIILPEIERVGDKKKRMVMDLGNLIAYKELKTDEFILYPNRFVLASTNETIKLPKDLAVRVEGRSSVGRLGLQIQNAGLVDPGFQGQITLEIFNAGANAVRLVKGMRIGQLVFEQMIGPSENGYSGKYMYQMGATPSMIFKDKEFIEKRMEENNGGTVQGL